MDKIDQVTDVLSFILKSHPSPIKILVGDVPPPSTDELIKLVEAFDGPEWEDAGKVDVTSSNMGPQERIVAKVDQIERIIADVGGWDHIVATVKEYKVSFPRDWDIFFHHILWIDSIRDHSRLQTPQLERVARKFGVSAETVMRRRRGFPHAIARMAYMAPVGSIGPGSGKGLDACA